MVFLSGCATTAPAPETSASALLDRGFYHLQRGDYHGCAQAFSSAIATGDLNDAGRALAYWHIYFALDKTPETSLDALSSFVVVAEDVLTAEVLEAFTQDFVLSFDLERRLAKARATLAAAWAEQNATFGRSALQPIPVVDPNEIAFFLEMAPPCSRDPNRDVLEFAAYNTDIQQLILRCHDGEQKYFFRLPH